MAYILDHYVECMELLAISKRLIEFYHRFSDSKNSYSDDLLQQTVNSKNTSSDII